MYTLTMTSILTAEALEFTHFYASYRPTIVCITTDRIDSVVEIGNSTLSVVRATKVAYPSGPLYDRTRC